MPGVVRGHDDYFNLAFNRENTVLIFRLNLQARNLHFTGKGNIKMIRTVYAVKITVLPNVKKQYFGYILT